MGEVAITEGAGAEVPVTTDKPPAKAPPPFADVDQQSGLAPDEPGEDEAPRIPSKKGGEQQRDKPAGEQQAPKKAKVKIADREVEFDEDIAELLKEPLEVYEKRREHVRAANEKFQKAAKIAEDNEAKYGKDALRQNPFALFQLAAEAGIDPTQLVAEYARLALAQEKMTPEQRQFEADKESLRQREERIKADEQKREQEAYGKQVQDFRAKFAKAVVPALAKFDLPDDEITVGEIGKIVAAQIRGGMQEDYESAAEFYSDYLQENVNRYLDRLSRTPGALAKKYPEIAKRLREEDVASVASPRLAVRPAGKQPAPEPIPSRQPQTWAEEEAEFRARRYGLKR